jgi:hypothetical protein
MLVTGDKDEFLSLLGNIEAAILSRGQITVETAKQVARRPL